MLAPCEAVLSFENIGCASAAMANNTTVFSLWLQVGELICATTNGNALGGYIRVWIGCGKDITQLALTCRAHVLFLKPYCWSCKQCWDFKGWFSNAWFLQVSNERIIRANTCQTCDRQAPLFLTPTPDPFQVREFAQWQRACKRCGWMFSDRYIHDAYICPKPLPRDPQESSDSSQTSGEDWMYAAWRDP